IANHFQELISGVDGDSVAVGLSSSSDPKPNSLVFVNQKDEFEAAEKAGAGIIVGHEKLLKDSSRIKGALIRVRVPTTLALAKISSRYFPRDLRSGKSPGVSKDATVDATAKVNPGAYINPRAVIESGATIEENAYIGSNTYIGRNVKIGKNSTIFPNVYIGDDTEIGQDVVIQSNTSVGSEGFGYAQNEKFEHFPIPQNGRVVIEDRVEIGANSTVDRATFDETRIGAGSKFDNHIHIAHNVNIGKNVLMCGDSMVAGSTTIGNNVMCGGRVAITDHIKIADNVQLGGMAAVSKDIEKPGAYGGYPLQPIKDYFKTQATFVHLVEMRKQIAKILKKMGEE
ncbi:MAG: UDP-3-O-(3-hydroxymyristoyl)glucosamine N-acyltransferase, partial [Bdellovibrionales bacterium]|nr:UDP-3-O-(3-hydroxymyristoyl)glucosamine N-acyltransferase [Bdellovibrionales bacterium]